MRRSTNKLPTVSKFGGLKGMKNEHIPFSHSIITDSLPPANGVVKVMLPVVSVHDQLFCPHGVSVKASHTTPPPYRALPPQHTRLLCTGHHPLDTFKFVHYEAWTIGKWAVGIRLKCLLGSTENITFTTPLEVGKDT